MKKLIFVFLAVICLSLTGIAFAEEQAPAPVQHSYGPSTGAIVGDILMRPFVVGGALISTAFCVATMPAVFLTGIGEQWARVAIEAPWRFAVARPLGEFGTYYDGEPATILHR